MTEEEITHAFNRFGEGKGTKVDSLSLSDFPRLLIDYYQEVEFTEVDRADDGDMLLFQYGTYDWGNGPFFEVDFTRQFYQFFTDAEDHEILQQSFTFYFDPEPFRHIDSFNLWSNAVASLSEFEGAIVNSQGYREAVAQRPQRFEISIEDVS
jgi:hypothetical protein